MRDYFLNPSWMACCCRRLALLALPVLTALPAYAHHLPPGMEDVDEFETGAAFLAGLRHPLLGMDHWLFAMAIGALAMLALRGRGGRMLLSSLLTGTAVGAFAGLNQMALPGSDAALMAALALPVLLWAAGDRLPAFVKASLVAVVAIWQGNAHGLAWPLEAGAGFYLMGMLAMTGMLAFTGGAAVQMARLSLTVRRSTSSLPL